MPEKVLTHIEVRKDGIYVIINQDSNSVKSDILNVIAKYQIKDVDYGSIEKAINENLKEQKISSNTDVASKNEDMDIKIAADKMSASVIFHEPINSTNLLDKTDIINLLNNQGVRFGINEDRIDEFLKNRIYEEWFTIAEGQLPVNGVDGFIEYFFQTDKKTLKPKLLADGSVDYRNLNLFETAVEGQVLAVSHEAIPGKDGMNVTGKLVACVRAKNAPFLPKGKNTKILEDNKTLISEISGRLLYADGKVSILPILEIPGNVDNSTGNVEFLGTVIVKGSVISGFSVTAGADIEIEGSVEGAFIKARGSILLMKGVQGGSKAVIEAGGDINANFIENAVISAGFNINANSIMHSSVSCGGSLNLIGKRGLLVGGKTVVGEKIDAKVIGSSMSTLTEIEVGINPKKLEEYKATTKELEKYSDDFKKTEKIIGILSKVDVNTLSNDKKKMLMDSIRSKILLKQKINACQLKAESLAAQLNAGNGRISVSDVVYAGVKVVINNAVMYIREDLQYCSLYNNKGKISIGSYN